jgi:hypothetical protein
VQLGPKGATYNRLTSTDMNEGVRSQCIRSPMASLWQRDDSMWTAKVNGGDKRRARRSDNRPWAKRRAFEKTVSRGIMLMR